MHLKHTFSNFSRDKLFEINLALFDPFNRGNEVKIFLQCLDLDQKNAVSAEDLLRVLQNNVEGVTMKDVRRFIKSITGKSNALLTEKDLQVFLEEMGF